MKKTYLLKFYFEFRNRGLKRSWATFFYCIAIRVNSPSVSINSFLIKLAIWMLNNSNELRSRYRVTKVVLIKIRSSVKKYFWYIFEYKKKHFRTHKIIIFISHCSNTESNWYLMCILYVLLQNTNHIFNHRSNHASSELTYICQISDRFW